MDYFSKIPVWENNRRLEMLENYRELIVTYFNSSGHDEARPTREKINKILDEVHSIVLCAGIDPTLRYTPPPLIGGYVQDIDLIQNIFNIHRFEIQPHSLIDFIDRAIGIYDNNHRPSVYRTINPLFWIGRIFDFIADLPFNLLRRIGFNSKKAEESLIGRISKGFLYFITAVASFLTILHLLGYLDAFKFWIKK